jgi:hypothetical protein
MPPVLAVIFWAWLLVSIVVLVRRRAAKRADRVETAVESSPADLAAAPDADVTAEAADTRVHATVGATPTAPEAHPPPTPPPGFETPVEPIIDRPVHRSAPAAGVADALVGIRMPCDLVPLVLDRLASDRITLSTTGHPAAEVGTALADEVERLGYVVRPMSDHEVLATRGATELRLSIRGADRDGKHLDHPTAREDAVVVEIAIV